MSNWLACAIIIIIDVAAAALYRHGYTPLFILLIVYMGAILVAGAVGLAFVIFHRIRESLRERRNLPVALKRMPRHG